MEGECYQLKNYGFRPEYQPPYPLPNHPPSESINRGYRWVSLSSCYGSVPPTALQGGFDIDGQQIYVGRAFYQGDWIPAKVIPGKCVAYICYGGEEQVVDHYEVLCEQRFEWVPAHGSQIPLNAVEGGRTSDGERLFIGRVYHEGSQTIGKVHPSHGVCYIPFDGKEIAYDNYEILVLM